MRLLISVRSVGEALLAARGGTDLVDLKDPTDGALGGLPLATIRAIVGELRTQRFAQPISATIGDLPAHALAQVLARVDAVGACGVDLVKVGIEPVAQARALIDALARRTPAVVPVFFADRGLDFDLITHAATLGFAALMLDTAAKAGATLLDCVPTQELRRFLQLAHRAQRPAGLAGALRLDQLPALAALAPSFIGLRSAVCSGARGSALDARRLQALVRALRALGAAPLET